MTRLTLCLTMLLSLVLAAQAAAKEVVAAKVCGAFDCREVTDKKSLLALHEGGPPTDPPDKAVGFYRAEVTVKGEGDDRFTFEVALLPGTGLIRGTNDDGTFSWWSVSDTAVARVERMTRGLAPIAAEKLDGLGDPGLPQARVDEVVNIAGEPATAGSGEAPAWPWIAGGVAALIMLGVAVYARARDHLGLHDHRNHPRLPGPQGGGTRPSGVRAGDE
jgi:hypothetical protein